MKKMVIVTLVSTVAMGAFAGPLMKGLNASENAGYSLGLETMSKAGTKAWQDFSLLVRRADKGHSEGEIAENSMALLRFEGERRIVHTMYRNRVNGEVTNGAFEVPPSDLPPIKTKIASYGDGTVKVDRKFDTPSGVITVSQSYKTANIQGKAVRTQSAFEVETPAFAGQIQRRDEQIMVYTSNMHSDVGGRTGFLNSSFDGTVVGFNLQSNGSRITFHIKNGDKFYEEVYSLAPKPAKTVEELRGSTLESKKLSRRQLTTAEVKQLGLLAEETKIAGRKASTSSAGGMKVDSSVGDSAVAGSGMQ